MKETRDTEQGKANTATRGLRKCEVVMTWIMTKRCAFRL